jgi:shikimate 5-dehydrogenase
MMHTDASLLEKKLIEKVGLFDEYFYPIYFEDNDFHERVARFCPENTIVSTSIQAPHKQEVKQLIAMIN